MLRLNGPDIWRRRTKVRNFARSIAFQLIAYISVTSKLADHVYFPEASRVSIAPGPSWLQTETTCLTDQRDPVYTTYLQQNSACRTSRTRQRLYSRKPGVVTKMRRNACLSSTSDVLAVRYESQPSETAALKRSRTPVSVSRNGRHLNLPESAFERGACRGESQHRLLSSRVQKRCARARAMYSCST